MFRWHPVFLLKRSSVPAHYPTSGSGFPSVKECTGNCLGNLRPIEMVNDEERQSVRRGLPAGQRSAAHRRARSGRA